MSNTSPDDRGSEQVWLLYNDGKLPILLEVNRNDAEDSLVRAEIEELFEFLAYAPRVGPIDVRRPPTHRAS